jgi:hypothetical protein
VTGLNGFLKPFQFLFKPPASLPGGGLKKAAFVAEGRFFERFV